LRRAKHIVCLLVLVAGGFFSMAQTPSWEWAKDMHTAASEWANDVAVDTSTGDIVAVGIFNSDISAFYGGSFTGAIGGGFVAKYNSAGTVLWAFAIGNNQDDACKSVAIAPSGNIYVTGYFQNIADFKGTLSTPSTVLTSTGGKDVFIAKYNPAGQLIWARRAGGITDDEGLAICTNTSLVFVTGYFTGTGSFSGIPTVSNMASENIFVAAYDANGNIQWLTDGASGLNSFARDITADNNSVYVTGDFKNSPFRIYDYMGANVANLTNATPASEDAYVLSLSVTGPFNWLRGISSTNRDYGRGIAQNANGIYVTGSISSGATFPSYTANPVNSAAAGLDMYVAQLSKTTGNTNWVISEQGPNDEEGISVAIDTVNAVCVSGYLQSTLTFGGGPTLTSAGSEDVFVAAYNGVGNFAWATIAGDAGIDIPYGMGIAASGEIVVAGEYENAAIFGSNVLSADLPKNMFVAKLGCSPLQNNSVSSPQTICSGQVPAILNGTTPAGAPGPYTFLWQQSPDNLNWSPASGTNNTQDYSPPALSASTYFRRGVLTLTGCITSDTSTSILITVDQPPTTANAGIDSSICAGSINLYANTPTVGTATWTLVSGTGTISSTGSPTTSVTGLSAGSNDLAWSISNGVCPLSSDTVTIKVYATPTPANAGTDQNICSSTYTLNANTPSVGTGAWMVIAGSATVTSVTSPTTGATGVSIGQNNFVWIISNGPCPNSSDTVLITHDTPPSVSNAGTDQSICASTYTLSAGMPSVGSGNWNVLSGASSVTTPTLNTSPVSGLSVGANNLEWVVSNGTCPATRDTVSIIVYAMPTVSNAGSDQTICSSTFTLNANSPITGSGAWSVFTGGASVTFTNVPNSGASGLSTGTNIFVWTITNGACPVSTDSVTIKVDVMPTPANAGSDQTICASSYTLSGNIPSTGTGNWNVLSGGSTISNPTQNNSPVTGLSVGLNNLEWTTTNGTCPVSRDTVSITVDAMPTISSAGSDQTICASTFTLNANSPSVGTGTWSVFSGGASVTSANAPSSGVSGLTTGANIFVWSISNGVCPSSTDSVSINVDQMPGVSNAGVNQSICNDSVVMNANVPGVGSGTWSVVSGGASLSNPSQNNSVAFNLTLGANVFMWSIANGVCPVSSSTVSINVDANPSPSFAGTDVSICSTSFTLTATAPTTGAGSWSVISGGATVSTATANITGASGLTVGLNVFEWIVSSGACPANKDTVEITVDADPSTANAGAAQTLCATTTTLNAVVPAIGIGDWSVISGGATVVSPSQNNSSVINLSVGLNSFEWLVSNGTCPPSRDTVYITVDANPSAANAGTDQTLCDDSTFVSAIIPSIGIGMWTVGSGGGIVNSPSQAATLLSNLNAGQNIFIWTVANGTCPSSSDTVVINIDAMPSVADAGPSQVVCDTAGNLTAVNPTVGTGAWSVIQGGATVISPSSNSTAVSGLSGSINIFQWTVSNGTCPSSSDTTVINMNFMPSVAAAGPDQVICTNASAIAANNPFIGSGIWMVISGGGTLGSLTSPSTTVNNLSTGQNSIVWTISNGVCPPSSDTVVITVSPFPSAANAGADQNVCINPASATLNAASLSIGNGTWTLLAGSASISNPAQFNSAVSGLSLGQNIFVWTTANGSCPTSSDTVNLFVLPLPTTANAGTDISISTTSVTLNGNTPVIGSGYWSVVSGAGNIFSPGSPVSAISGLNFGDNVFGWTISNGVCPASYDEVVIHVNDLVVPNGFSPNGDYLNDLFEIPGLDNFPNVKLEVFNRWGNLVYENREYKNNWDGKNREGEDLTDDTYYFTLVVTSEKVYKGFVVLKRK